jgi:general secretion pathway protein G
MIQPCARTAGGGRRHGGFTLIEFLAVLAIMATLLTLALPRYLQSVEHAKEAVLRENLLVVRQTLDQFYADRGRYPDSLQELVDRGYLRSLPQDPLTESTSTWELVPPPPHLAGQVRDLRSGAPGLSSSGQAFSDW